jgi:amino acid adenylation domain-containing protein
MRLTDQQREVWLASQMNPAASTSYNWPLVVQVTGPLELRALADAVRELAARHEALRASFTPSGDMRVAGPADLDLPVIDLRHFSPDQRAAAVRKILANDTQVPFDLAQAPLARAQLLRLDDDVHELVITLHHIIADGWAGRILITELGALYKSMCAGLPPSLPPAPSLAAYQQRQASPERQAELAADQAYWAEIFSGGFQPFDLPVDRPRPAVRNYAGNRLRVTLPSGLAQRVRRLSVEQSCTLFMTMLAAFEAFAFRLTGRSDVVIGAPFANRDLPDDGDLVVHCANLLALRSSDVTGDVTFSALLQDVRQGLLAAYEHGAYPLIRLAEDLGLPRDPRRLAHISTVFNIEQTRSGIDFGENCTARATIPPSTRAATFDFIFTIVQDGQELSVDVIYNKSLYADATVRRWAAEYEALLTGVAADPRQQLSELPLLPEPERRLVLTEWNATAVPYPRSRSIPELFEEQADTRPEDTAVRCGVEMLTYGELNARANRVARWLREAGVGPESPVGLCMNRSADLVVALLGILKAGGAYLPLDPTFPVRRLRLMAEDAAIAVIVADEGLMDQLPADYRVLTCANGDWPQAAGHQAGNLGRPPLPGNLAYVAYTSGSTGQPKGVMVTHRNVIRLLFGPSYMRFGPARTFLALAPVAFDASTFELWGPLLHGGTCVIFPAAISAHHEVQHVIRDCAVDTMFLTTRLFDSIVDHAPDTLTPLAELLIGGEAMDHDRARRALGLYPGTRLSNVYGPTECTTFATCYPLPQDLDPHSLSVPIGRPIANTLAYVLDGVMRPVPIGVRGELYLGGDGVARGYLGRPGLTAERYLPDLFGEPGRRMYRTGDIVRWRQDGQLEIFGRADDQFKLKGFRIEPGEIEMALRVDGSVSQAVVTVREDQPGERRLVGYVVPTRSGVSVTELLDNLRAQLPPYLVPSELVILDALPVQPNGKLDRSALPAPVDQSDSAEIGTEEMAPEPTEQGLSQDEIEQTLSKIFADVLGRAAVGRDQDFFQSGGDSLGATQVIARVFEEFAVELPLPTIFEAPTVAGMTLMVLGAAAGGTGWDWDQ